MVKSNMNAIWGGMEGGDVDLGYGTKVYSKGTFIEGVGRGVTNAVSSGFFCDIPRAKAVRRASSPANFTIEIWNWGEHGSKFNQKLWINSSIIIGITSKLNI